jgi:nucleoside-diphosphate-sugar epimerase
MLRTRLLTPVREVGKIVLKQNRQLVMKLYGANQITRSVFKSTEGNLKLFPARAELESYARVVSYPADRLKADTGFAPRTSFEEGTALSADWLRLIGVV